MCVSTVEMLLVMDNLRTVLATVLARLRFSPAPEELEAPPPMLVILVMLILFLENMLGGLCTLLVD